jgi:hypothetical protein
VDLAEIPDVAQRPTGAARVHRGVRGMERRAFLRMTLASAGGASLLLLGRLPTACFRRSRHRRLPNQSHAMPGLRFLQYQRMCSLRSELHPS